MHTTCSLKGGPTGGVQGGGGGPGSRAFWTLEGTPAPAGAQEGESRAPRPGAVTQWAGQGGSVPSPGVRPQAGPRCVVVVGHRGPGVQGGQGQPAPTHPWAGRAGTGHREGRQSARPGTAAASPQVSEGMPVSAPCWPRPWFRALHEAEVAEVTVLGMACAASAHQVAVHLAGVDAQDHTRVVP